VIIRYEDGEDGKALIDREALAAVTERSPNTIRARLRPALYDEHGRALYIYDEAIQQLREIPTRRRAGRGEDPEKTP